MFGAIVVLWLGSAPQLPAQHADLAAWATARQLSPMAPEPAPMSSYDAALVAELEALLEEARAAPTEPTTDALERAEALLLAHPELPQAAWLLAERYALGAHALGASEAVAERRNALVQRSRSLEGGRATSAGQAPLSGAASLGPRASDNQAFPSPHARPGDRLLVDGVFGAAFTPGRHHLQLYRGGLRVWASWVDASDPGSLAVRDPTIDCSALDLADVAVGADGPRPAPGVRCRRWLAARPAATGGTELAECAAARCGRWQPARGPRLTPGVGGAAESEPADGAATWPAWGTWGLVGAGAVASTFLVLWQVGVFDRSRPDTEFVFTGPSAAAYRF
jgi:hypothetical protein